MKRSEQKRITREAKIIRYMRISKGMTHGQAGLHCNCSEAAIGHYENGRMDISPSRLSQLLKAYGYTREEFDEYRAGKPIPVIDMKAECTLLLGRIDETKLKAVHAVLTSFVS